MKKKTPTYQTDKATKAFVKKTYKPAKTGAELLAFFQNSPLAKYNVKLIRDKSIAPPCEFN